MDIQEKTYRAILDFIEASPCTKEGKPLMPNLLIMSHGARCKLVRAVKGVEGDQRFLQMQKFVGIRVVECSKEEENISMAGDIITPAHCVPRLKEGVDE